MLKVTDIKIGDILVEKTTQQEVKIVGILEDGTIYYRYLILEDAAMEEGNLKDFELKK